jgi:predicted deacylase
LDFHTSINQAFSICYGYAFDGPGDLKRRNRELALSFGGDILCDAPTINGSLTNCAVTNGVPAVCFEIADFYGPLGERGCGEPRALPTRTEVEIGVTGIFNLMKFTGMMDGELDLPERQVVIHPETRLSPTEGGLLFSRPTMQDIGRVFARDELIGEVVSPYDFTVREEIRAPYENTVLIATTDTRPCVRVNPGDFTYFVSDWDTAEWYDN